MYDKDYAMKWIQNYESRKDNLRVEYIEPILKQKIQSLPENLEILDIGCGWGTVVGFLKDNQKYYGVDINSEFFSYIEQNFPYKNINLIEGSLPDNIKLDKKFDFVMCSMVLHCIRDLEKSLESIFFSLKSQKEAFIIDFSNNGWQVLKNETFNPIYEQNENYIKGIATLSSGIRVLAEAYNHNEENLEEELQKYGSYKKQYLGQLFVSYEIVKK